MNLTDYPRAGTGSIAPPQLNQSISVIVNFCEADEKYLYRCLSAIEWQIDPGDEVIIVCDSDTRIPFTSHGLHTRHYIVSWKGICKARNAGAARATCRWLKFIDVDDVLAPFALSCFRKANFPETVKLVKGAQTTILNGGFNHDAVPSRNEYYFEKDGIFLVKPWASMRTSNPALVSHTFIERTAFNEVGGFDGKLDWEEEWDLWLRIGEKYGPSALAGMRACVCYCWISEEERAKKTRVHEVNAPCDACGGSGTFIVYAESGTKCEKCAGTGKRQIDVHRYLHEKYGINPGNKFTTPL